MSERVYAWSEVPHLAQRTLWSLRKPVPDPDGEKWLLTLLSQKEGLLYRSMSAVDRAHAIGCARQVDDLDAEVIVASALHDVGKTDSGLGTPGRVLATLAGLMIAERARGWAGRRNIAGQIATYLDHPERGALALTKAGSSSLAIAWAREHHLGDDRLTIEPAIARRLRDADDAVDG